MKTIASIYKSITESKGSTDNKGHWENYNVAGVDFEQDEKYYRIKLDFTYDIIDDSDYDRQTGYGKHVSAQYVDTVNFEVEETDDDGNKLRDTNSVEKDTPGLYKDLFRYAKEAAIESIEL